jgi:hypothetical protein
MTPSTETKERKATQQALDAVYQYIKPGTNEGISYEISRLTDDLFTDSFLGGGDISLFTPAAPRGTIKSQLSSAFRLDSNGGAPTSFPFDLSINLSTGKATLQWTDSTNVARTATLSLDFLKEVDRPEGKNYLFGADEVSDDAVYGVSLITI